MNTEQFFRLVLPEAGLKVLSELVPNGTKNYGWRYTTYTNLEAMAEAAIQFDSKNRTIYHACNAYGDWYFDEQKQRRRIRTQQNVVACRSLYDDIDVGKPDSYATRKEAGAALKTFIAATKMPTPTIIYSGGGLHLYWPLDSDITPEDWQRLANKKRLVTDHAKLLIDTACDTDSSRVLRPVGTTWRKDGERVVECRHVGDVVSMETMEATLDAYIEQHGLATVIRTEIPDFLRGETGNLADLTPSYAPAYMDVIAQHCEQIRYFQQTGGDTEPLWHLYAGVAKHCVGGEDDYHAWSSIYDGYDEREAQEKLNNWTTGPTTCDKFKAICADRCASCKHKCKSPIALGCKEDAPPVADTVVVETPAGDTEEKKFEYPELWPFNGFSYNTATERMMGPKKDSEGVIQHVAFAAPLFYVVDSIQQEDGTSALVIERLIRGRKSRFELPTKYTADVKSLKMQLASYRITTMNDSVLMSFVQKQMELNRIKKDEINTYAQLGWHNENESFLIGTKLITKDEIIPVRVGKAINEELQTIGTCKGNKDAWIAGVDELYNRPGAEPYQLAICLAFGGIFGPFMPSAQWRGIPFALTSDRSGLGKSTVSKIALNIYAQADATMVTDSTAKGMIVRTGAMGMLPFLMDEITKYVVEAKDMSDLLYALSNGKGRLGSTAEGVERKNTLKWNVPVFLTGNRNILHHVTEHNLNPEAVQMRVFEVDLETYPVMPVYDETSDEYRRVGAAHKALTDDLIANHYGIIGEEWVRWCITNKAQIKSKLYDTAHKLRTVMHGGNASKERYYYDLATMMLVGGYFAKKLGYINFDLNNLKTWIVRHISKLRSTTEENKSTPEDLFAHLMSDLNGHLLITNRFDGSDRRSSTTIEMDQACVRGTIHGRVILGNAEERPRVYVATRAVTEWCKKNGVQYAKLKRDLMALNLIRLGTPGCNPTSGTVRIRLGKGVAQHEHLGQVPCLEFDAGAAQKHLQQPAPVVDLPVAESVAA